MGPKITFMNVTWVVVLAGWVQDVSEPWLRTCWEPMEHKALSWVLWSVEMDSDLFQVTVGQSLLLGDERDSYMNNSLCRARKCKCNLTVGTDGRCAKVLAKNRREMIKSCLMPLARIASLTLKKFLFAYLFQPRVILSFFPSLGNYCLYSPFIYDSSVWNLWSSLLWLGRNRWGSGM